MIEFKECFCIISDFTYRYLINMGWIPIRNFCLDSDLGKFKTGSGSLINSFGSTTLEYRSTQVLNTDPIWIQIHNTDFCITIHFLKHVSYVLLYPSPFDQYKKSLIWTWIQIHILIYGDPLDCKKVINNGYRNSDIRNFFMYVPEYRKTLILNNSAHQSFFSLHTGT